MTYNILYIYIYIYIYIIHIRNTDNIYISKKLDNIQYDSLLLNN